MLIAAGPRRNKGSVVFSASSPLVSLRSDAFTPGSSVPSVINFVLRVLREPFVSFVVKLLLPVSPCQPARPCFCVLRGETYSTRQTATAGFLYGQSKPSMPGCCTTTQFTPNCPLS